MIIDIPYGHENIKMEFPDATSVLIGKEYNSLSNKEASAKIEKGFRDFSEQFTEKNILLG